MRKSKLFKGLIVLILMEVIFLSYIGVVGLVWNREKDLPQAFCSYIRCFTALDILRGEMNKSHCDMSKKEFREFVEDDIDLHFYIYKEKEFKGKYVGNANPVTRTITLDKNLEGYYYYVHYTHEAMHLKHFVAQEDYVCFETFKYLYESEELHDVGVWYGIKKLTGFQGKGEYCIDFLIVDYLTKN